MDGTLAEYHSNGDISKIGKPIEKMIVLLRYYLSRGFICKIFTTRASVLEHIPTIKQWLSDNNLPILEITNIKTFSCILIFDDRAVQVEENTGRILGNPNLILNQSK